MTKIEYKSEAAQLNNRAEAQYEKYEIGLCFERHEFHNYFITQ